MGNARHADTPSLNESEFVCVCVCVCAHCCSQDDMTRPYRTDAVHLAIALFKENILPAPGETQHWHATRVTRVDL